MSETSEKTAFEFEMLKRYGAKWAVLAAMTAKMAQKGIAVPHSVFEALKTAKGKIASGCFSTCEVNCDLALVGRPAFLAGLSSGTGRFPGMERPVGGSHAGKTRLRGDSGHPGLGACSERVQFCSAVALNI